MGKNYRRASERREWSGTEMRSSQSARTELRKQLPVWQKYAEDHPIFNDAIVSSLKDMFHPMVVDEVLDLHSYFLGSENAIEKAEIFAFAYVNFECAERYDDKRIPYKFDEFISWGVRTTAKLFEMNLMLPEYVPYRRWKLSEGTLEAALNMVLLEREILTHRLKGMEPEEIAAQPYFDCPVGWIEMILETVKERFRSNGGSLEEFTEKYHENTIIKEEK